MWHSLISPQPNKYAEIIMPRQEVERGTNFIIEDEAWTMIEADFSSVEGIIYMSLTESKVNYQYDDLDTDIADTDKLKFPILAPIATIGEEIVPDFGANTWNEWEIEYLLPETATGVLEVDENGHLQAIGAGQVMVTMRLKNRPAVTVDYEVTVNESDAEFVAYLDGQDSIRLDRYAAYSLTSTAPIAGAVTFSLDATELATISKLDTNECVIHANAKNKLGEVILHASYGGNDYSKTIKIIPLW